MIIFYYCLIARISALERALLFNVLIVLLSVIKTFDNCVISKAKVMGYNYSPTPKPEEQAENSPGNNLFAITLSPDSPRIIS